MLTLRAAVEYDAGCDGGAHFRYQFHRIRSGLPPAMSVADGEPWTSVLKGDSFRGRNQPPGFGYCKRKEPSCLSQGSRSYDLKLCDRWPARERGVPSFLTQSRR